MAEKQRQLLLDTLSRLWSHYLQASECNDGPQSSTVKEHWLWLLLYNFQFLDDETLQDTKFNSLFNLMPEELCSYLLEQVYEIISAAKRTTNTNQENEQEPDVNCIKELRKQHNLAQLILSTPSDCNKILALRTFLTNELGQHLLDFLLRVDIKHIASQKSLCQLCINLFPDCKWSETNSPLQPLTSLSEFIVTFHLTTQRSKTRKQPHTNHSQPHQHQEVKQKHLELKRIISSAIYDDFEGFKSASKSSDDLALLLIQLLTRCIHAERDPSLSVAVHNFALGHLCTSVNDNETLDANDEIIKFELLQLITHCVNNFYAHELPPNVLDFNGNFSQLLYALAANRRSVMLSHGILYIMFGTLHNLVELLSAQQEQDAVKLSQIDASNFDACFDVLLQLLQPSALAALSEKTLSAQQLLFLHIYKILLRLTDNLARHEQQLQCIMESSSVSGAQLKQQPPRHKRHHMRQLHCTGNSLSCYFQGKLYQLVPLLCQELQELSVSSLHRSGSCCCHYNAANYAICLRLATQLSGSYQKSAYKFLNLNVLHTIFVRAFTTSSLKTRSALNCVSCDEKLKSPQFHRELLQIYKTNFETRIAASTLDTISMLLFLKHLKHISYLLTYDLAAGILAEVVLPIFRHYKTLSTSIARKVKGNQKLPPLHLPTENDNQRALHECLSIFVMYLSDIRLVKAFYNEENIRHMEDLLSVPELQRGVCDLIKVGIDNIAFLGENSHEQIVLSRRLIQLQLNSSNRAAQLFHALLQRCSKQIPSSKWPIFWLDESQMRTQTLLEGHKPADILYITTLQWTLNYELLKTSQFFYNEFAKIYSIPLTDNDSEMEVEEQELEQSPKLRHGDKTIVDILKLNYNALSCYLLLPTAALRATTTTPAATPTPMTPLPMINGGICTSSSLGMLISPSTPLPTFSALSISTTNATNSLADSTLNYASITDNYAPDAHSFLKRLQAVGETDESIVLFDIRANNIAKSSNKKQTNSQNNIRKNHRDSFDFASDPFREPAKTCNLVASSQDDVAAASLIGRLFNIVGAFFGGSRANSNESLAPHIDADLLCLFEPSGDCKKLLLKLFETTMAICIKGYQNEEVEKMQKHLRKLKSILLSNASDNWKEHSEQHARDNTIMQALQTLLKIAELSNTHHEPAAIVSSSDLNTAGTSPSATTQATRPRARSFNSGSNCAGVELPKQQQLSQSHYLLRPSTQLPAKNAMATPPTPRRPISGESGNDVDYFSTRASLVCAADSELEFSENDQEYYLTADEGYEADGEIHEMSESECEMNGADNGGGSGGNNADMWHSFQPSSRYRTHIMHEGLSRLVVEILIELSMLCMRNPIGWTESLTQLANRLFVIRDSLGGPLCLLRGFAPLLRCNDARLRELQHSILELITHLNTPDVLQCFFSIMASKQPPMDILMKYLHHITSGSLRKVQPCMELEFPLIIDGKIIGTADRNISTQIDRVRNYHLQCQTTTLFTRAPIIVPVTHTRLWHSEGLTISLWLELKGQQFHRSCTQLNDDDTRCSGEDLTKSHIVSIGTNQAMLSIYISNNMQLVFEMVKPNEQLPMRNSAMAEEPMELNSPQSPQQPQPDEQTLNANNNGFRQALKQTKMALLNSIGQMHFLNGIHGTHGDGNDGCAYYEGASVEFKYLRLPRNKWTHLLFAIDNQADSLSIGVHMDGLEQHTVVLPFQNFRVATRSHSFQMLAVGDGVAARTGTVNNNSHNNSNYCNESRSTLDGCAPRYSLANLMLFKRKLKERACLLNLTAMGPDFTEFTQCQVANWKPNYGYLNLSKLSTPSFGNFAEAMKLLRQARVLVYTAQNPELVMGYDASQELDNANYGQPFGHILYGELLQQQLQTLQTATMLSGGLPAMLYLFARVVEVSSNANTQALALNLLLHVAHSDTQLYTEFQRQDYMSLIGYVIKSERCSKDVLLLRSILNNACSQTLINRKGDTLHVVETTIATLVYPQLLLAVLQRYSDWHRSGADHSDVLDMLFRSILALTRDKHPHRDFNMEQLLKAGLLRSLLNLCKVYVIESPNPVHISKYAAECFVQILAVFAGSPPSPSLLDEIMKLLLLLQKPSECYVTHDRANFYFLLTPQPPARERSLVAANLSRVTTPFRRNPLRAHPGVAQPAQTPDIDAQRAERIKRLRRLHASGSAYRRAINEFEENLENVADCSNLNKSALRLLSPVEATRWRLKFKRHRGSQSSPKSHSPKKIARRRVHVNTSRTWQPSSHSTPSASNNHHSGQKLSAHHTLRHPVKTDFYDSMGIITLQRGLLTLLKDFLCLLPDSAVDEVLKHYVRLEFLLVLSNHQSSSVRTAIIRLLSALTQRLAPSELLSATKQLYPLHLANQLTIHNSDEQMFEACVAWVSGIPGNLDTFLNCDTKLCIRQRFGIQAVVAIAMKNNNWGSEDRVFKTLQRLYLHNPNEQQNIIEAGLLQCAVKALHNIYSLRLSATNMNQDQAIVELLGSVGEISLKSVGQINIVWDILNMLTFYQDKQPPLIVRSFRAVQALLQLNWLNMFFVPTNVPWSYRVTTLSDCALSLAECRTRLELLVDRCAQYFTASNCDANYVASVPELSLFELLVSYGISTNQRCNNFIAWGLQPSRPRELRAFIVDALWISCQDDSQPAIICDGKMIKALLWLSLLEDLVEPIANLPRLCQVLGINEHDSTWNLEHELERIDVNRSNISAKQKTLLEKTIFKFEVLVQHSIETSMVTTRRVAELQNAERKLLMCHMKDYDDTYTYNKWLEIIRRMTHEGAPWYSSERAECSWELDDTEGPSRVHTRLRRCHLDIPKRFFMTEYRGQSRACSDESDAHVRPLDYLISSYDQQLNISLNSHILYNFPAKLLPIDGEIDGEIIITDHKLYFLATYRCKYFNVNCDIANITEIWLKRYQHQEKAFEIFLDTNKSLLFSLQNADDWKIMCDVFCDKIVTTPDNGKVLAITQQWREGLLTNWEYLMTLNQIAGRTYNDLMQYPVFPWVLSNYKSDFLDLCEPQNFRRLARPIAVQLEENEQHYINNYTYINNTNTNMGSLILKPYHYSSHYSNSGTVLHFLVRVPPFTTYFLRYQDNNFDLPDRTFHALSTTWCLASRDSPTDVKELIPEFFCLPEMFENFERFNFGLRQNGERVEDVLLPNWCQKDPRLFVLIHRQALESELVRNNLHHWIDLIFGYKQTGESAVEAINVFHPATYAVFLESEISDPIERDAVHTMVKTYGQMPRQLFKSPHSATKAMDYSLVDKPIVSTVKGLRWGVYVGSPQLKAQPSLADIRKIPGTERLVSFSNTNVVYALPARAFVMQGAEPDTYNVVSWGYDDRLVRIQPLNKPQAKPKNLLHNGNFDDITACGCDVNCNQLWLGHKSGRISVYKCSSGVEAQQRGNGTKSRQSYVRLRLSYNSAFRKMTTKSVGKVETELDHDTSVGGGAAGAGIGMSASCVSSVGSTLSNSDALQRDGADLSWVGPTVLVRHSDEITCITLSVEFKIAVTAGRDGIAVIWDLNDWSYVRTIARPAEIHQSPITHIAISPTLGDIVTVHTLPHQSADTVDAAAQSPPRMAADECFEVTEESLDDFVNVNVNPNGKSILRLHSVNAHYVQHLVHEDRIQAVCYSYIKEGVGVNVIATAVEGGFVRFWSSWDLSFVGELVTGIAPIKSITYSTHQHLVVLTRDSHIQVWESEGLYGNAPKFPQIVYK
ncbi:uncharacterized protein LOC115623261 [Scaptodrosophila lebanonensis]|uniref:Uncharacterized protein LOC115623261 n=1 Tax=Drosophila lebanonensis TaxID=7225 RepID=A0A6J2TDC7_DROLE|nr:uncharacterized protein LOC115623261 [Scaptodrosophila lebanonensis]